MMSIPALHSETEQLFIMAEAANCRTLCVTACHADAGVTSLAMAIAERYMLAGYKTLLLDLNLHKPSFFPVDGEGAPGNVALIADKKTNRCFQGLCCNLDTAAVLEMRRGAFLNQQLEVWQQSYDRIVVDTSPILHKNKGNIPANLVAAACDKTLLAVLAGKTTKTEVQKALKLLDLESVSLLGTVLNLKAQPTLQEEIEREINRLNWLPDRLLNWLIGRVNNNKFISTQNLI